MEIHLLDFINEVILNLPDYRRSRNVVVQCGAMMVMMNIRFLIVCLRYSFPSNFSVIASISLNSICREIPSELVWSLLGSRHVFHIFFILFGAIILSRGIFRFAAALRFGGGNGQMVSFVLSHITR